MKVLGMKRTTFGSLSKKGFHILYGTYVRPHSEYCAQVWTVDTVYCKKNVGCLEKAEQRARLQSWSAI